MSHVHSFSIDAIDIAVGVPRSFVDVDREDSRHHADTLEWPEAAVLSTEDIEHANIATDGALALAIEAEECGDRARADRLLSLAERYSFIGAR